MKKNVISIALTLVLLYLGTAAIIHDNTQSFNIKEQINTWLFSFVYTMGFWGYIAMAALLLGIFLFIRWCVGFFITSQKK